MTESKLDKYYLEGSLPLKEVPFDHIFRRKVMASGSVCKVYLPKELKDKIVHVVAELRTQQEE